MTYQEKLRNALTFKKSALCVGLDPNLARIPDFFFHGNTKAEGVLSFCKKVIDHTLAYAASYKINTAYFEALGPAGFDIMFRLRSHIPADYIVIADAKRGDVPHTSEQYNTAFFTELNADAITLNPLMGFDCIDAYRNDASKGLYVLALTSNSGAADFFMHPFRDHPTMAHFIASRLQQKQAESAAQIGMVIGATQSNTARDVLLGFPDCPLLIPGIGAQGGNPDDLLALLQGSNHSALIAISRAILYPEASNPTDWSKAVEKNAKWYQTILQPISSVHAET